MCGCSYVKIVGNISLLWLIFWFQRGAESVFVVISVGEEFFLGVDLVLSAFSSVNVPKKMKMSDGVCDVKLYAGTSPATPTSLSPTAIATVVNNHVVNVNNPSSVGSVGSTASSSSIGGGGSSCNGNGISNHTNTQNLADYLAQLIKDKKQLAIFPNLFLHLDRILDEGKFAII